MNLEQYKQQGLDLFKRFEIALPEKKTERVLQVGNEISYSNVYSTNDSKHLICFSYGEPMVVHIRELPSGKCVLSHTFEGKQSYNISEMSTSNIAVIRYSNKSLFVKFPEGDIVSAIEGSMHSLEITESKKGFIFKIENEFYLYYSSNNIIKLPTNSEKIEDVIVSSNDEYALIIRKHQIEVFSLTTGETLYTLNETYRINKASISSNSKYFLYTANEKNENGCIKIFNLESGELTEKIVAISNSNEFKKFSNGWVFHDGKIMIYYPQQRLLKEVGIASSDTSIAEDNGKAFLVCLYNYRDNDYIDRSKLRVFDINRVYDFEGNAAPIITSDQKSRWSRVRISPNGKFIAYICARNTLEVYKTGSFEKIGEIKQLEYEYPSGYFSSDSLYFLLTEGSRLIICSLEPFALINKPISKLDYCVFDSQSGNYALTDSSNNIQLRRFDTGEIVFTSPKEEQYRHIKSLINNKIYFTQLNSDIEYLYVIYTINNETKQIAAINGEVKSIQSNYIPCSNGIFNSETETINNYQIEIPKHFGTSYFTSYLSYSFIRSGERLLIFENKTGKFIREIKFNGYLSDYIINCGNKIIYEKEHTIYIEDTYGNTASEVVQTNHSSCKLLKKINEQFFVVTYYDNSNNTSQVYLFDIDKPDTPINEWNLKGNIWRTFCSNPDTNSFSLASSNDCWYFEIGKPEVIFSFPVVNFCDIHLHKNVLVAVSENNKIEYFNTQSNSVFKPGELLATLYTIPDGFLWTIPPDAASPDGWFYTDHPEYIEVMQYVNNKQEYELLTLNSPERQKYIELHNRKDLVMARLHNPETYANTLADLQNKMQHLQLKEFKHALQLNGK